MDRVERLREERKYADAVATYRDRRKAGVEPEACGMSIAECREWMGE